MAAYLAMNAVTCHRTFDDLLDAVLTRELRDSLGPLCNSNVPEPSKRGRMAHPPESDVSELQTALGSLAVLVRRPVRRGISKGTPKIEDIFKDKEVLKALNGLSEVAVRAVRPLNVDGIDADYLLFFDCCVALVVQKHTLRLSAKVEKETSKALQELEKARKGLVREKGPPDEIDLGTLVFEKFRPGFIAPANLFGEEVKDDLERLCELVITIDAAAAFAKEGAG